MRLTVFYSWQSDRPSALCRQFIRIALDDAAKRLAARRSVEVIVDADTEGVPGTPPITETILQKIKACDVFVADVSFVAETAEGKRLPNPNVIGEFGYALSEKGWRRILLVMNTAFGPAGDLPFDLGHFRKPAAYEVGSEKPDSPRRNAREALSARLEANLEAVLDDILATAPATQDLWQPLQDLWVSTQNARVANNPPCLVSPPSAYVYVVPAAALAAPRIALKAVQADRRLLLPDPADRHARRSKPHLPEGAGRIRTQPGGGQSLRTGGRSSDRPGRYRPFSAADLFRALHLGARRRAKGRRPPSRGVRPALAGCGCGRRIAVVRPVR